jgi:hypothetical protein
MYVATSPRSQTIRSLGGLGAWPRIRGDRRNVLPEGAVVSYSVHMFVGTKWEIWETKIPLTKGYIGADISSLLLDVHNSSTFCRTVPSFLTLKNAEQNINSHG